MQQTVFLIGYITGLATMYFVLTQMEPFRHRMATRKLKHKLNAVAKRKEMLNNFAKSQTKNRYML